MGSRCLSSPSCSSSSPSSPSLLHIGVAERGTWRRVREEEAWRGAAAEPSDGRGEHTLHPCLGAGSVVKPRIPTLFS